MKTISQLQQERKELESKIDEISLEIKQLLADEGIYLCVVCEQVRVNPHEGYDTCELCSRRAA